jgi:hypothetical protein
MKFWLLLALLMSLVVRMQFSGRLPELPKGKPDPRPRQKQKQDNPNFPA